MKYSTTTLVTAALALCASCNSDETQAPQDVEAATAAGAVETAPPAEPSAPHAMPAAAGASGLISGEVVETMNSGGYTYVLVDTGTDQVWAAGPETAVPVGADVSFDGSMTMADYSSPTLERTFDTIYFTGAIQLDAPAAMGHGAAPVAAEAAEAPTVELLAKADGGVSIEEVFAGSADLVGTELVIRGQVVKFTPQILGKNWLHIQDGTGAEGTHDLTLTTDATAALGDIVLVRGVLAADKDFGYGYKYDLIIEDAEVSQETSME